MNCTKSIFILLLFLVCVYTTNAQTDAQQREIIKTVYYYKFEGAKSVDDLLNLSAEIYALKGVTEFKPEFKPESGFGQLIVVVTEKRRTSEGDELFEITSLKKILEKKGYHNLELTSEVLSIQ